MIKISVIIPTYNTCKYIEECLKSIVETKYRNLEVIIVDDSSTDDTCKIINKFTQQYKFIKLYNISHQGVASARNVGIKKATGDYLVFIDSDDIISKDVFSYIDKLSVKNIDCFVSDFDCISEDASLNVLKSENLDYRRINNVNPNRVLNYFYSLRLVHTMWRFIVKRDIVVSNNIFLTDGIIHEDEEWIAKMLINCEKFYKIPFNYYVYRKRKNSIMATKTLDHFYGMMKVATNLIQQTQNCKYEYQKLYLKRTIYKMCELTYYGVKELSNPDNPV